MSFKSIIKYDYNIDNMMEEGNLVGEFLGLRCKMSKDANKEITDNKLYACYTARPFVWMRTAGIDNIVVEEIDGILWHRTPMKPSEIGKKEGARFLLTPNTITLGYWYKSDILKKCVDYVDDPENIKNAESEEFIKNSIYVQNILHGPYNALINVLKRKTDKEIKLINNDVSIDGKKICGIDQFLNDSGTFQIGGINYYYDDDLFRSLLTEDAYHRKMNATAGLTGVSNEIPNYSKEEFTQDWVNELEKLIAQAEKML